MTKNSVCAVVVTYNRKELLLECLEVLLKQTRPIDAMYIIDNFSSDGTPEALKENGYIINLPPDDISEPWERDFEVKNLTDGQSVKIHYVRMNKNTGGAGGFYEGIKRGYEKGYDWLWLMDDDAEPKEDALEKLSKYFVEKDNISALASVVKNSEGISYTHRGLVDFKKIFPLIQKPLKTELYEINKIIEIDTASFVGILVNKKAIQKIGYPKKEFFIHHDDIEYCVRLRQAGRILLVTSSIIFHKEAARKQGEVYKHFLGRDSLRTQFDKLWISYYGRRNLIWLGRKYSTDKFNFYLMGLKDYIRTILGIIIYDDHKLKRIEFITNAYLDGLIGIFDNKKPKKILYKEITN